MKTYALVGTGGRSSLYIETITGKYRHNAKFVAFCDTNQTRMDYANQQLAQNDIAPVPTCKAASFDDMLTETKPDIVIVSSMDRTHDGYIVRALHAGCDVITEKPMTIDENRALRILDTVDATGYQVRVAFNYRYAPHHSKSANC